MRVLVLCLSFCGIAYPLAAHAQAIHKCLAPDGVAYQSMPCASGAGDVVIASLGSVRADSTPRAETPTHLITLGFDPDLDDAAKQALRGMIRLLVDAHGLGADDAYMLCSLIADLRVTQLVDGNKGIHCMLAKRFLPA